MIKHKHKRRWNKRQQWNLLFRKLKLLLLESDANRLKKSLKESALYA